MRRIVIGILVGMLILVGSPANAAPKRISYGEVRAHFNAWPNAGRVIFTGNDTPAVDNASPASVFAGGIRPLAPWDGASYCVDDWHVILIAFYADGFTKAAATALFDSISVEWVVDGAVVAGTERTPVKPGLKRDETSWAFQDGSFWAPGTLAVGSHTVQMDVDEQGYGQYTEGPITFYVDAVGTGACL